MCLMRTKETANQIFSEKAPYLIVSVILSGVKSAAKSLHNLATGKKNP